MTATPDLQDSEMVRHCLRDCADDATPAELLRCLTAAGLDRIPLPGRGNTSLRWRMLAAVGRWARAQTARTRLPLGCEPAE